MSSILNASVLKAIECPCCMEHMRKYIFNCSQGHSICCKCRKSVNHCPTCRQKMTFSRNFALEEVAKRLKYPCPNAEKGCTEYHANNGSMGDHIEECGFRDYKCMLGKCGWMGLRAKLRAHAVARHQDQAWMDDETIGRFKVSDPTDDIQLIYAFDEMFYLYRKISDSDIVYWCLQYIGKSTEAQNFGFQITIFTKEYENRKISIKEECQSDLKDISEIIESGRCISVPMEALNAYRDDKYSVWLTIKIIKV